MKFEHALRLARLDSKKSQSEVAEILGVTQNTISRWETGRSAPNAHELIMLGEEFGITLDELCGVGK